MDADSYGKNLCRAPKKNSKMSAASRTCLARLGRPCYWSVAPECCEKVETGEVTETKVPFRS